jgi:tRNA A-37 threonylcarbamoyl transferase component Bud32/tetratricopeptide (TPR) repeat protein
MAQGSVNANAGGVSAGLPAGAKLGKYEIVERLGVGGESIVYKAYDAMLDRHVAVKQIPPNQATDEQFMARFRDVARQLAKLGCEQIVTIYELIDDPQGLFVVMEYVAGHSLESSLADSPDPVDPKAVLQILWRIAAGLSAIHKGGIIHRDIKPGNIMVGDRLRVKITDFGVAARAGTAASMRLGTTKYMAPELFGGDLPVDARADIYSLGVIAYEMLAGRAKFNEIFRDVVRDPHSEALRWMKWHSSPQEKAPPLTEVNPAVPPALSAIVEKMMSKDVNGRYLNLESMGKDIRGSFSPRAQRPPVKGHKARRLSLNAAADAEGQMAGSGEFSAEGGEELTMLPVGRRGADSGPATAAIPKKPMARSTKIALFGGLAAAVLVAGAVWAITAMQTRNRLLQAAERAFADANLAYVKGNKTDSIPDKKVLYAKALEDFKAIAREHEVDARPVALKAGIMAFLSQAQLDVLTPDWKAADENVGSAEAQLKIAQRGDKATADWADARSDELSKFRDYFLTQRKFAENMQAADEALKAGKFDVAMKCLDAIERLGMPLLPEQSEKLMAMKRDIAEQQKQGEFWAEMKQGDDAVAKGDIDAAIRHYNGALTIANDAANAMSDETRKNLIANATTKIKDVKNASAYDLLIKQAHIAEAAGDMPKAIRLYEEAPKIKPDRDLQARVNDMKFGLLIADAKKKLLLGQLGEAQRLFREADKLKPGSPDVKEGLATIASTASAQGFVAKGDKAFQAGDFAIAQENYEKANQLTPSAEMKAKITECIYQSKMKTAVDFRKRKEYDKAKAVLEELRTLAPAHADEVDAIITAMATDQAYDERMNLAEVARLKKNWAEALTQLAAAGKLKPDAEEAKAAIKQVRHDEYVEKAKASLAAGDYADANANLTLAKSFMTAPEDEAIAAQIAAGLKKTGG